MQILLLELLKTFLVTGQFFMKHRLFFISDNPLNRRHWRSITKNKKTSGKPNAFCAVNIKIISLSNQGLPSVHKGNRRQ